VGISQKRFFEKSIAHPCRHIFFASISDFKFPIEEIIRREKMNTHFKTIAITALTIATALLSFKLYAATPTPPKPAQPPQPQVWTPGCVATVPKSWGTFRGASTQSGLAFEDSSGTIRFLTNIPCDGIPSVSLEIHRTAVTTQ
jgi:hypothetical protein